MARRVVISGLGVISPIGNDVESFWNHLIAGQSGVTRLDTFDVSEYQTQIAALVKDFNPDLYMDKKDIRKIDRFAQFAIAAAAQAVADSGLNITEDNADNVGVYIGSGIGGISTLLENYRTLLERGPRRVSPFLVPMMIANIASGEVSIRLGAKGPNSSSVTACASSTHAIGDAFKIIQRGDAEVMIAGGAESAILDITLAGFGNMRAMSTRNDDPEHASRPFERDRDGFVIGEGAGIIVLESLNHALARGAHIHAEVIGYGMSGDAYHVTHPAPEGAGAYQAMKRAINDAGVAVDDVDYINAHGTSTEFNDKFETIAIKRLFGEHAYKLAVSSTKSMTGHLLGAAGGVEAVATALALEHGILPPTTNYENPDPELDLDYVPNQARNADIEIAMSNSFGFGGHNACVVLRRYHEQ